MKLKPLTKLSGAGRVSRPRAVVRGLVGRRRARFRVPVAHSSLLRATVADFSLEKKTNGQKVAGIGMKSEEYAAFVTSQKLERKCDQSFDFISGKLLVVRICVGAIRASFPVCPVAFMPYPGLAASQQGYDHAAQHCADQRQMEPSMPQLTTPGLRKLPTDESNSRGRETEVGKPLAL
nr:hypothetical protein Iba_chr06fCG2020 [Ipomoea batatas]